MYLGKDYASISLLCISNQKAFTTRKSNLSLRIKHLDLSLALVSKPIKQGPLIHYMDIDIFHNRERGAEILQEDTIKHQTDINQ